MNCVRFILTLTVAICCSTNCFAATILNFDFAGVLAINDPFPIGYGSNVNTADTGYSGDFDTPNVTFSTNGNFSFLDDGNWIGSNSQVGYFNDDGGATVSFTLTADAGFEVTLNSFLSTYYQSYGDGVLDNVTITGGTSPLTFTNTDLTTNGFLFSPNYTAQSIVVTLFDADGNSSGNFGLDNISFSQSPSAVPEPSTLAMLSLMSVAISLVVLKRRRAIQYGKLEATQ